MTKGKHGRRLGIAWMDVSGVLVIYCDTLHHCVLWHFKALLETVDKYKEHDRSTPQVLAYVTTAVFSSCSSSSCSSLSQGKIHDILHHDSARLHAHTSCFFAFSALSAACLSALLLTFSAFFLSR